MTPRRFPPGATWAEIPTRLNDYWPSGLMVEIVEFDDRWADQILVRVWRPMDEQYACLAWSDLRPLTKLSRDLLALVKERAA